ncbi:esterase-like activity of phytase family protein [Streptomyces sp. SCL15-6]|uniref:esterase-like activity of phytase family protein n=1 Tax=Streptomyces sp. SCL15-6 TaxID=2967222 RepID=UPI002967315D|nr:esterase-like activity of phytase family protein [Streptomyces sp. SCL15-6]
MAASLFTALAVVAPSGRAVDSAQDGPPGAARACSPWVRIDGFSDELDKTAFSGVPVSELSGVTEDAAGRLLVVADDSYEFELDARTRRPVAVLPLAYSDGTGLDAEAIAVDRDGTRLISDETQPSVNRFSPSGRYLGSLPVPDSLKVAQRATRNLTFEGMALLAGKHVLVASMEGALKEDGPDIRRLQTWERSGRSGSFRLGPQYALQSDPGLDISDITSTPDGRLLVVERGYTAGAGNTVRLYLADPRRASDVSATPTVRAGQEGLRLVRTTLLADIADCPSLGATTTQPQPNPLLDNIEGVTVTGRAPGGRLELLLLSDDNGRSTQITRLYSLTARLPEVF